MVFLALTAEEKGLLGSEYYAQQPLYPPETTVAVYNMDGGSTWGRSNDVAIAGEGKISLQRDLAMAARRKGREFSPDPRPEAGSFFRSMNTRVPGLPSSSIKMSAVGVGFL